MWSTFSLLLPHYHPNTRKYITFFSIILPNYHPNTGKETQILIFQNEKKKILPPTSSLPSTSGDPNSPVVKHNEAVALYSSIEESREANKVPIEGCKVPERRSQDNIKLEGKPDYLTRISVCPGEK